MKIITTIGIIAVLLLAANVSSTQTLQTNAGAGSDSDPAIAKKLGEIVSIYQRLVEANKRAVQSGKGETDGRYELALAKARLQLARELGQQDDQVAALKDALNAQQRRLEDAKARAAVGAASSEDLNSIRVAVLKAEVRLLRAQNSWGRAQTKPIAVGIAPDGAVTVSGCPCSESQLVARLSELGSRNHHGVVIRAEEYAPFKQVFAVMDACKMAGLQPVTVSTAK